jgi:hypothetical protein
MAYRGSDKKKLEKKRRDHQLCRLIEQELQKQYDEMGQGEWRAIMAHQVAWTIGADPEEVRRIMCRIQGGSNGVTFHKPGNPDAPRAEAPALPPSEERSSGDLVLGQRVEHDKFGPGSVVHIEGQKIEVEFDDAGRKRVMESFVRPVDQ